MTPAPPAAAAPDRIVVRGLRAHARHGVLAAERSAGQPFGLDLDLEVDARAAAASDELGDTVDYATVAAGAVAVLAGEPVALLETLADRIAGAVLSHPGVRAVTVTVHKPQAPLGLAFDDVAVVLRRTRPGPAGAATPADPGPIPSGEDPA